MTTNNQKPQLTPVNKTTPGANGRNFIPFPSNCLHYIHHDKMNANKMFLYTLIIDFYNVHEGYAWPSQETLGVMTGITPKTIGRHLKDLERVGLIFIPRKGRYVPLEPLDAASFYDKFPEAWALYKETLQESQERSAEDLGRLTEYRERNRGTGS